MNTVPDRRVYISVAEYLDELGAGILSVADVIDKAHGFGVDGIELRREPWPAYARELASARQRIQDLGLGVTYATHNVLFSPDADAHQLLLHDVDTPAELGSPLLRVFAGRTPAADDDPSWEGAREAVEHAASLGIVVALENYVGMPGGTLAEVSRILDRIQSPAMRTNIDVGNYAARRQDVIEAIRAVGERAVSAHLKDYTGDPSAAATFLGNGLLPLPSILSALDDLPQPLLYCFEFPGGSDPDGRIETSLAYLERQR